MPVIKRYPNRKLYDTAARQYIALDGVAALPGLAPAAVVDLVRREQGDARVLVVAVVLMRVIASRL